MMRALWISKTGMEAQQTQLDVTSNNLANAATNGFKRSRAVFEDLLYQTVREAGAQTRQEARTPTGLQVGTGVRTVATVKSFTQGNLNQTNGVFDLAINGRGFFQVQGPEGQTAYTRAGNFSVNQEGQLVDQNGYQLLEAIDIPDNATSINVSREGEVSGVLPGDSDRTVFGQIQLADFINPSGLSAQGQNLYFQTEASGEPVVLNPGQESMGSVYQGYVETSNVNVVEELINLIQTQRVYEINSRSITTADEMLQRLNQV